LVCEDSDAAVPVLAANCSAPTLEISPALPT